MYVGVGMGSGICALLTVRDLLGLKTEIIGVSAVNGPATALSFEAGNPVTPPIARTFADGIATREPVADVVETIRRGAARFVKVSEDEMAEAVRACYDDTHQVAEGAGVAPLGALLQERGRSTKKGRERVATSAAQGWRYGPVGVRAYDDGIPSGSRGNPQPLELRHEVLTSTHGRWYATASLDDARLEIHDAHSWACLKRAIQRKPHHRCW